MAETQAQENEPVLATGDTVAATPPAEQTDATQGQPVDSVVTEELSPTDDEKESWNSLPPDVRAKVNRVFTKARQRDSQKLKEHPGNQLLEAYQRDPVGFYQAIEADIRQKGLLNGTPKPTEPNLSQQSEQILEQVANHYGPEGAQLLRQLLQAELKREIEPLRHGLQATEAHLAKGTAEAVRATFEAKHPGALQKYERDMTQMALKLTQGGQIPAGVEPVEWLGMLYKLVAHDQLIDAKAADVVTRMQKGATAEKSVNAVPQGRVTKKAPQLTDFKSEKEYLIAAGEAALRGEDWG